jgi:pilus assembly protein CpaB
MRTSSIVISIVAVVMGAIAALLAVTWLRSQTIQASVGPPKTIVVAGAPLGLGVALAENNLIEIPWGTAALPDGAFASKTDLLKDGRRVTLTQIERNEPVLRTKITGPGETGSLSSMLEGDKRAVTVRVDDVRGVAGLIRPNDRVDVVLIRSEGGSSGKNYSDVILHGARVLAVDQITGGMGQAAVAKVVTLEVTSEEAQKVVLAENIGKLSLILRQAGAGTSQATRRVTEGDLALGDPPQVAAPPPPAPVAKSPALKIFPSSDTTTVAIVRGLKREEYSVMQDGN